MNKLIEKLVIISNSIYIRNKIKWTKLEQII